MPMKNCNRSCTDRCQLKAEGKILAQYMLKNIHNLSTGQSWKNSSPHYMVPNITPFLGLKDQKSHLKAF